MLPMRIMKVAPMHRMIGMDAEFSSLTKFPKVRKFPLNRLMRTHSARSTATGAHLRQCPRRVPFSAATGFKSVLLEQRITGRLAPGYRSLRSLIHTSVFFPDALARKREGKLFEIIAFTRARA
jgi:hypothetical protein